MRVELVKCDQCGLEHGAYPGMVNERNPFMVHLSIPEIFGSEVRLSNYDLCDADCAIRFLEKIKNNPRTFKRFKDS